jgi:hypothetical protein
MVDASARIVTQIVRLLAADDEHVDSRAADLAAAVGVTPLTPPLVQLLTATVPAMRGAPVGATVLEQALPAYLANWAANRRLLAGAAPILEALGSAHCRPVALKGLALLMCYYEDLGVRSVADLDVLIDPARAETAWQILTEMGGVADQRAFPKTFAAIRAAYHAWQFMFPGGFAIDLHWSPFSDCFAGVVAEGFLAAARPITFGGLTANIPSPEHLLLHVCVHGVHRASAVPDRWMLDAATLVGKAPAVDWSVVADGARAAGLEHALVFALRRLRSVGGLPGAPDDVLHARRASILDRVEVWAWHRDELSFRAAPIARVLCHLSRYRRLRRFHPAWRRKGLRDYWRLYRQESMARVNRRRHG